MDAELPSRLSSTGSAGWGGYNVKGQPSSTPRVEDVFGTLVHVPVDKRRDNFAGFGVRPDFVTESRAGDTYHGRLLAELTLQLRISRRTRVFCGILLHPQLLFPGLEVWPSWVPNLALDCDATRLAQAARFAKEMAGDDEDPLYDVENDVENGTLVCNAFHVDTILDSSIDVQSHQLPQEQIPQPSRGSRTRLGRNSSGP